MPHLVSKLPTVKPQQRDRQNLQEDEITYYEVHVTPLGEPLRPRPELTLDMHKLPKLSKRYGHHILYFPGTLLASTEDLSIAEAICQVWNRSTQRTALHGEAWIWEIDP